MRINYSSTLKHVETNHEGFSEISQIMNCIRAYSNTKVVFNLCNTLSMDGSMASVYAAMSYYLSKSENSLSIKTRNEKRLPLTYRNDLLGKQVNWGEFLKHRFWNGGTPVKGFSRNDFFRFEHYLIKEAFDPCWRDVPVLIKQAVKLHLRRLFKNASEHCDDESPIFISSSFRERMLRFTIVDCGHGFLKGIKERNDDLINEQHAIMWAVYGGSCKGRPAGKLRALRKFCSFHLGSLLIASGYSTVGMDEEGNVSYGELVAPFRGSIVSFSLYVPKPDLIQLAA